MYQSLLVFHYNDNADVKMYYQSGKEEILRKVSAIEEIDMDDGSVTQAMKVVDQDSAELYLGFNFGGYMILVDPEDRPPKEVGPLDRLLLCPEILHS